MAADSAIHRNDTAWLSLDTDEAESALWVLAIAFYGVGDLVSTIVGLWLGATEGNPLPAALVDAAPGLVGAAVVLTVWKVLVLAGFVLLARRLRSIHRLVVPGTLAVLGVVVVAWNTTVLVVGFA
ncbi:DUF5658 family protein [Natranaeroarchaeum sulfidigenes]|uniref:Putative membrane protein n=1 Tax=Natranaeroarchaeum sulfidigenes TaxID=2784880 RepID=A0A897MNQ7_9EURY|nr:DUF5658 family protein [Natranaeroarchaeum sulfidigenes]QSG02187.1 putative membrane protein [Natranaeroarchaeum sulfidigenes]